MHKPLIISAAVAALAIIAVVTTAGPKPKPCDDFLKTDFASCLDKDSLK